MSTNRGDDLDDDYAPDDLVAESGGEEVDVASSAEDEPEGSAENAAVPSTSAEDSVKAKKRKRREKEKEKRTNVRWSSCFYLYQFC